MTRGQLFGPLVNSMQSFITMSQNYCPGIFLLQKKATYLISIESKFQLLTKHQFQTLLLSLLYSVTALTSKKKGELRKSCEQCTDTVKTTFKFIFPLHITFPLWLVFISLNFFFFTEKAWLLFCDPYPIPVPPLEGRWSRTHCKGFGYREMGTTEATFVINPPQEGGGGEDSPFTAPVK